MKNSHKEESHEESFQKFLGEDEAASRYNIDEGTKTKFPAK